MANRNRRSPPPHPEGPTIPPQEGCRHLSFQIDEGRALLAKQHVDEDAFYRWQTSTARIMEAALGRGEEIIAYFRHAGESRSHYEALPPDYYRQRVAKSLPYVEEAIKLVGLGIVQPAGQPAPEVPSRVNVTINAPVGNINLGTLLGDVDAHATALADQGQGNVATALRALTDAVLKQGELRENDKQEAAEALSFLAEQGTIPPDRRKPGMIRSTFVRLQTVLSLTADLQQLWQAYGPALAAFFGMGG